MEWIILFTVGVIGGTIGSLMGLGGGIIVVPALLYLGASGIIGEITPQVAVGTSLLAIIATGLSSTISYFKKKLVDVKSGLLFFIGSGPGSIAGSWANGYMDSSSFSLYFGLFIIFISIVMFLQKRFKPVGISARGVRKTFLDENGEEFTYGYNISLAISISFIVGFSSGLFGIGGGALMVPAMLILFQFPPHIAVATSMFMIFLSAITSSFTHLFLGNIEWILAFTLIPGAWLGAKIGAYINVRLKANTLTLLLRVFLFVLGIRLIYDALS